MRRLGVKLRGEEKKDAATLGTIYHKLQQAGQGNEKVALAWVKEKQNSMMERVQSGADLDGSIQRAANALTSLYRKAEVMARIFWERFPQPPYFKEIGKEVVHQMSWEGMTLEGTIDKVLQIVPQEGTANLPQEWIGSIWDRDHKSTSQGLNAIFTGLAWGIQGRFYRLLTEDCLKQGIWVVGEKPQVKGFILDGITTPGIKMCKTDEANAKKWNCSVEDAYLRRVEEWYKTFEVKATLAGAANKKAIDSKAVIYAEPALNEELVRALRKINELYHRPLLPEMYGRDVSRSACFVYRKQCIFHDLCTTDPAQWDRLFETKYIITRDVEEIGEEEEPESEE